MIETKAIYVYFHIIKQFYTLRPVFVSSAQCVILLYFNHAYTHRVVWP